MDLEVDDNYVVEHEEDFRLNEDQFRKLIQSKFERNKRYALQLDKRESQLKYVE